MSDVMSELAELLDKASPRESKNKVNLSKDEQTKILQDFLKPNALRVGDLIQRNKQGLGRYNSPRDDEVGIVTDILPLSKDNDSPINGAIAVLKSHPKLKDPIVVTYLVDLRYYEKAK